MPSLGVIAKRFLEYGTGQQAGQEARRQQNQKEYLGALDVASKLGAAGIDPTNFTKGLFSPGNPNTAKFDTLAPQFLEPYKAAQASATAEKQWEMTKFGVEQYDKQLDRDLRREISASSNATTMAAAQLRAASSNGGGSMKLTEADDYDKLLNDRIRYFSGNDGQQLFPSAAFDADGVLTPEYEPIFRDLKSKIEDFISTNGLTDPRDISRAVRLYVDQYGVSINRGEDGGWFGSDTPASLATTTPTFESLIAQTNDALAQIGNAADREAKRKQAAQVLAQEFGRSVSDVYSRLR